MAWSKTNWVDLTSGQGVFFQQPNSLGGDLDDAYDAFIAKHDSSGNHNDDILCRGWARVDAAGGTPTTVHNEGIVTSANPSDDGVGIYTVTLTTAADTVDKIAAMVTVVSDSAAPGALFGSVQVKSTTTLEVRIFDTSEALTDADFCIAVWIEP